MKRLIGVVTLASLGVALVLLLGGGPAASGGEHNIFKAALLGHLRPATLTVRSHGKVMSRILPFISSGTLAAAQQPSPIDNGNRADAGSGGDQPSNTNGSGSGGGLSISLGTLGCSQRNSSGGGGGGGDRFFDSRGGGGNVRVNQDCTFRRQAEEDIVANPSDPSNLVAGQNDSRVGFNQCGFDYSIDNGQHWGDGLPPFRSHINDPAGLGTPVPGDMNAHTISGGPGDGHTYDAASDPTVAFDSQGRAFFGCVVFDINSNASGLFVTQSPKGARGSFYYNVGQRSFMVVDDNAPTIAHDKEFITADTYSSSPNRDNVYVTWSVFKLTSRGSYQQSPIYGSMSTDHAHSWSTPEVISGTSDTLCFFGDFFTHNPADVHACNFDQGSDPVVLPNGDLEVIFNNGNTPATNPNAQQLAVHCHPTGSSPDGTAHLNCAQPSKVGDDILTGEPACNFGRGPEECIPGAFIRTNDYPRIVTNAPNGHLYAVWQDYRNQEFDIQLAQSTDGGLTWREVGTLNPDRGKDHYFAAVDQWQRRADLLAASYYRTDRVPNESAPGGAVFAPCGAGGTPPPGADFCAGVGQQSSDYAVAGGSGGHTPFASTVVSPRFPPPDGIQAGFNGDYSGIIINRGGDVHPIWSDTRNADPFAPTNGVTRDEDIFTQTLSLLTGGGNGGDNGNGGNGGNGGNNGGGGDRK